MKKLFLVALAAFASSFVYAQGDEGITHTGRRTGQKPFPIKSYVELDNPVKTDLTLWKKVKGTYVSWGSTDVRYKKEEPAMTHLTNKFLLTAWKGERVSAQFAVWGDQPLNNLSFEVSDLVHSSNNYHIPQSNILKGFVRYVMTDELNKDGRGGCGARPNSTMFDSTLVADPIDHLTTELAVKPYTTQAGWIRIQVPRETEAGMYTGTVTVKNGGKIINELTLKVRVIRRTLPAVDDWSFHLDLWQNPFAIARYHKVELWSKEHFECMRPYMEMYKNAGGKVITTSIMHKPWNGQTYDPFETMVTWVKKADGKWFFDYTVFDRWVEFMMDLGITKEITCYSMVPWRLSFQYFDQATNTLKEIKTEPGKPEYNEMWGAMLSSFAQHLKAKGWFNITHISMDERPEEVMKTTLEIIRKADPDFKISLAGALHEDLLYEIDDYCVALRMKYSEEAKTKRKEKGMVTTYYTSCEEPYPNTFTFAQPADCEWFGWYAARKHLDGYLRWAYNSWVIEPLLDSRFITWAAGDTYLIYPGARTSIRFERMIEGIQAYEKVSILRREYKRERQSGKLKSLEKTLQEFDEMKLEKTPSSVAVNHAKKVVNR